ncbi:ATP-binding protein [Dyadobacter luticola]|uniref:histidine kinase n=1 Tax=Dyadobacter luticola TaxID=1979387 RepID=A0A5R9KM47_9BACT|nr:ATP-binding protein [Dyadobacter luticola]TLU97297.1 hypothetical protein FEN17_26920 [Dyadobacter luticola]
MLKRSLLSSLLIITFFASLSTVIARDNVLKLDKTMLGNEQRISLASAKEWIYRAGNNPDWARTDFVASGWEKKNPSELSVKDADKEGRVEGWFRLRLVLDSTFQSIPLDFRKTGWAAVDLYVDGKLIKTYGITGSFGKSYKEYYPYFSPTLPIILVPGQEHMVALHWVDYVSPLFPEILKSTPDALESLTLFGPDAVKDLLSSFRTKTIYLTLWLIISAIMTLLFWLIPFQGPQERNVVRSLAVWGTLTCIHNLFLFIEVFQLPYSLYFSTFLAAWLLFYVSFPFSVVAIAHILGRPLSLVLRVVIIAVATIGGIATIIIGDNRIGSVSTVLGSLVVMYLLVAAWKNVRGAQWPVVVGAIISLVSYLTYAAIIYGIIDLPTKLAMTGALIAIPLSFVVYIILRFREILMDVESKAAAVVRITEEKQDLLASQNQQLEMQVEERTSELNKFLKELTATQAQLVQKEKLASLGELTAGIAHEIQNPLNFVNNFSELSEELVVELEGELSKGYIAEASAIAVDIRSNVQKIRQHGGRASNIVRGMLEHSRSTSGDVQPTDLNQLIEEYLRLAYQAQLTKHPGFHCELITDFDPELGQIDVVPQEIGRVLLNLFGNAFYTVYSKGKQNPDFKPLVWISTKLAHPDSVEIRVRDNGMGIPEAIKSKIMQPFFTTKPTGEGTGLGLSLSYDIITKAHGGSFSFESSEGEWSEFYVKLFSK